MFVTITNCKKVILINVTHITPEEAVYLLKNLFLCIKGIQHANYMNNSNKYIVLCLLSVSQTLGVCNCSMFCCMLLCVHSSVAVILVGEERADCFA